MRCFVFHLGRGRGGCFVLAVPLENKWYWKPGCGHSGAQLMSPFEEKAFTFLVTQIWVTQSVRIQVQNTEPLSLWLLNPDRFPLYIDISGACSCHSKAGIAADFFLPTFGYWELKNSTCELLNRDFAKDSFTLDRKINFLKRFHLELVSGVSPSTTEEHTDDIQVKMKVNGLLSRELRVPWFAASY